MGTMALEILTARFPNVKPDLLQAVLAGSTPENPQDFLTIIRGLKPFPGYTAETTPVDMPLLLPATRQRRFLFSVPT